MARGPKKPSYYHVAGFLGNFSEFTSSDIHEKRKTCHVVYPSGKPMIQHLLRSQGIGVNDYSLTLDALRLLHPRLLER
jgi:hypothetical protein